jgi:phosphohistidine phosphatase
MEVYILRHGIAEERGAGRTDAERKLTAAGKEKLRAVLSRARAANVMPSAILTSPFPRAMETAEIAAEVLGYKGPILATDTLLPSSSPPAVWRELRHHGDEPAILLAGHEPLLSELASFLLGTSRVVVDMKKGALLRVDIEDVTGAPRGVIRWLMTPKLASEGGG